MQAIDANNHDVDFNENLLRLFLGLVDQKHSF